MERRRVRSFRGLGGGVLGGTDVASVPSVAEEVDPFPSSTPKGYPRREGNRLSRRRNPSLTAHGTSDNHPRRRSAPSTFAVEEENNDTLQRRRASGEPNTVGTDDAPITSLEAAAWDPGALANNYQDVREELELSGHNLTSVLNNPRETFMDSLYEAAFETTFETEPHPPLEMAGVPPSLREVTLQDVEPFVQRTGSLSRVFARNHKRPAGRVGDESGASLGQDLAQGNGDVPQGHAAGANSNGTSLGFAGGLEEGQRYGLGLRKLRNGVGGSAGGAGKSRGVEGGRGSSDYSSAVALARVNGGGKRGEREFAGGSVAQCFEQVPSMFFDKEFSLQDPAVFEGAVMAAGSEQPERLAHYLDLVEVCLLKQISQRSNAFFEGLKTSQDLQAHVGGACVTLYQLRENMRCMQQEVVAGPMRVPQLQRRRSNLAALEATLEQVTGVQQAQGAVQGLLAAEDYLGALDIIHSAKSTLQNDLGKLQSLKNVGRKLAEYEGLVSDLLSNRFVHLAVTIPVSQSAGWGSGSSFDVLEDADWGEQRAEEEAAAGQGRGKVGVKAETDAPGKVDSAAGDGGDARGHGSGGELREELQVVMQGLLRLGEMGKVLGVVQDRVSEDLKLIIRTVVGDFLATTDDSGELMDTFHLFGDETLAENSSTGGTGRAGATSDEQGADGASEAEPGEGGGDGKGAAGGGGAGAAAGVGAAGGQSVAKLKTLDGEAFCSCLEMCFEHMLSVLNRVSQIHEALATLVGLCQEENGSIPPRPDESNHTGENRAGRNTENGAATQPVGTATKGVERREAAGAASGTREEVGGGTREGPAGDRQGGGAGAEGEAAVEANGVSEPSMVMQENRGVVMDRSRACLRALSELMERSVSQLLGVRREHNCTKLDVHELKHLWDITVSFIQSVERLSGCTGYKLRSTLLSQAKGFVEARHEANRAALVKRLDSEKWIQADVTPERQAILDRLCSGKVFPPTSARGADGTSGEASSKGAFYGNGSTGMSNDLPAQPSFVTADRSGRKGVRGERRREAVVDGVSFKAVGSALVMAEMAVKFLQYTGQFPAISTDVLTRLGELLRVFNSRSTQLVLGAGAIHSAANLKSISAKHLALCSQSLGLVRALIPRLQAALATRLPRKHHLLLAQMDTVAQDYRDHRDKIFSKFVSMIEELIEARSSSLKLTDWDAPGSSGGGGEVGDDGGSGVAAGGGGSGAGGTGGGDPCQFTADLRRGVTAMHNVLQQQLPPDQLQTVFRRMFTVITRKVPACFEREGVSPSTAAGRQRILDDIGFVCAALSTLRGVDASTLGLEQAIAERYGKPIGGDIGGRGISVA